MRKLAHVRLERPATGERFSEEHHQNPTRHQGERNEPLRTAYSRVHWGQFWGQLLLHEQDKILGIKWIQAPFDSTHHHQNAKKPF
jgi:hypothetical protein